MCFRKLTKLVHSHSRQLVIVVLRFLAFFAEASQLFGLEDVCSARQLEHYLIGWTRGDFMMSEKPKIQTSPSPTVL